MKTLKELIDETEKNCELVKGIPNQATVVENVKSKLAVLYALRDICLGSDLDADEYIAENRTFVDHKYS